MKKPYRGEDFAKWDSEHARDAVLVRRGKKRWTLDDGRGNTATWHEADAPGLGTMLERLLIERDTFLATDRSMRSMQSENAKKPRDRTTNVTKAERVLALHRRMLTSGEDRTIKAIARDANCNAEYAGRVIKRAESDQ